MSKLDQLKQYTTIVADSCDFHAYKAYQPQDATTNPSLLLIATSMPNYQPLLEDAIDWAKKQKGELAFQVQKAAQKLLVNFGIEILKIIPGRVSTEVDARLSFDTEASVREAHHIIELYQQQGIDKARILIKVAATWEGIKAAQQLEREGIHCNMTLIFHFMQAVKSAEIGATLVSPFVGRIYDWYKNKEQREFTAQDDPGVLSVKNIYQYLKQHKYATQVMGASFRNLGQIEALAGCDYLTISPQLLMQLQSDNSNLPRNLTPNVTSKISKINLNEQQFRWGINEDAMATEKLAEGIRLFAHDAMALEQQLAPHLKS